MRVTLHYCLSALLAMVSISAPFAHTHDAGKAEEHLAQEHYSVLHAHIALPNENAALSEADESARRVNWFRFEHKQPVAIAPPAETALLEPLALDLERATFERSQAAPEESPPRAVSPRGPPLLFA